MNRNKIARDTVFMTAVQLGLQGMSLLLNIFITRKLGSAAVGTASLIYTFFGFATIISNGNIYLISSRFISEEIGCSGNPNKVFRYAVMFSSCMSLIVGTGIFIAGDFIGNILLKNAGTVLPIRIMALSLPMTAFCSCLKGYFNAIRRIVISASSDAVEFVVRAAVIAFLTEFFISAGRMSIFMGIAISIVIGEVAGLLMLMVAAVKYRGKYNGSAGISFRGFAFGAVPIILNSILTSVLSSANDALVPLTLKQYGNTTKAALSQFGIFEAIIIPTLFFPSVILCSLSNILVPELSRERGADNADNVKNITEKVFQRTFVFSMFASAVFLCFGNDIGILVGGDAFAGKIIRILSPAVPFIYLEIVLEGILRGMGKHSFSSVNYLAEYTIRISVLLICVPLFGFYGIVASYLASNIICNISRIIMIIKVTGAKFRFRNIILKPLFSLVFSMQFTMLAERLLKIDRVSKSVNALVFVAVSGILYIFVYKVVVQLEYREKERGKRLKELYQEQN